MKPSIVFVAPEWNPELDELLNITKNSFQIKVLTQRQSIEFNDPYIEILQCFESYSPLELAKLIPWLIQLKDPQFHILLPQNSNKKQLAGIGAFISVARTLPQSFITHSPWRQKGWGFRLWAKTFQNLFDGKIDMMGHRFLSPFLETLSPMPKINHSTLDLYKQTWVFPYQTPFDHESKALIQLLLNRDNHILEFWTWDLLNTRLKNKMRDYFSTKWSQFQFRPPRTHMNDWGFRPFLVLFDPKLHPFSETDLIDLVINYQINLIMDQNTRNKLQGPWKEGKTFWLWHPELFLQQESPWNNSSLRLSFDEIENLRNFRDQNSNNILRTFLNKDSLNL